MKLKYFDAHTHAQFAAFKGDYREVIERALRQGVGMVNVGTQKDTSFQAVELTKRYENVYATVGLHPIHTAKSFHDSQELGLPAQAGSDKGFTSRGEDFNYDYYKKLALDPNVVAIGECGLDYAVFVREQRERLQKRASAKAESDGGLPQETIESKKNRQKEAFLLQIELAHDVKKPLMIHCRDAFGDLIKTLEENKGKLIDPPGIIHFFSGTLDEAKKLLEMGFYFTFGGVITFARDYDKIIQFLPLARILSETDAPYVAPVPYRGKRNEPVYVIEVVKKLAEIKGISREDMQKRILKNVTSVFNLQF